MLRSLWRIDWKRVILWVTELFYFFLNIVYIILICFWGDSGEICWMIYKFPCSAIHSVNIPQLDWQLMYNILHTAGSSFSCSLVFYVEVVSVALCTEILWSAFHFRSHLPGCFFKEPLSPTLKLVVVQFVVFCACLNLFSSKVFLAMASAR